MTAKECFALPEALVVPKLQDFRKAGLKMRKAEVTVGEFVIDAYIFSDFASLPGAFILSGLGKVRSNVECVFKGKKLIMFVKKYGHGKFLNDEEKTTDTKSISNIRHALPHYLSILRHFSRITGGMRVYLHMLNGAEVFPPFSSKSKTIHIVTNISPPGDINPKTLYLEKAFGLPLSDDGYSVRSTCPARGRGIVLKDNDGQVLAQVLKDTFYFLVPIFWNFHSTSSPVIFEKLLALAWNEYQNNLKKKKSNEAELIGSQEFVELFCKWQDEQPNHIREEIENHKTEIKNHQENLAMRLRCIKELSVALESLSSSSYVKEARTRLPDDYTRLSALPDIEKLWIAENGIHVETKPIVIEHEGVNYFVGPFVIRLSGSGKVFVWSENPVHPKGIPHPHMSKNHDPCFGNATNAIVQASADYRIYDAISYVIRWLKEGYTSDLADVKIEEWPKAKKGEVTR